MREPKKIRICRAALLYLLCLAVFWTLEKIHRGGMAGDTALFYGGEPGPGIYGFLYFLLFVCLAQFYNSGMTLFFVKNRDYLCVRYDSRERIWTDILRSAVRKDAEFLAISLLAALCICACTGGLTGSDGGAAGWLRIMLEGFGKCVLISLAQIVIFLWKNEETAFLILTAISVLYLYIRGLVGFYPFGLDGVLALISALAAYGILMITGYIMAKKYFIRRF